MFYYPSTLNHFFNDFPRTQKAWSPACEIEENNEKYLVSLETAGIPRENLKLEVIDQRLVISGEKKSQKDTEREGSRYTEREYGQFQKSFSIPSGVDPSQISAAYEDGVLQVEIPKPRSSQPLQIPVRGEKKNVA